MKRLLTPIALIAVVAGCVASGPPADATLQPVLRPHDVVYKPDGDGPFPTVMVLHGCLGVRSKDTRWAQHLRDPGYVALVVDSMTAFLRLPSMYTEVPSSCKEFVSTLVTGRGLTRAGGRRWGPGGRPAGRDKPRKSGPLRPRTRARGRPPGGR